MENKPDKKSTITFKGSSTGKLVAKKFIEAKMVMEHHNSDYQYIPRYVGVLLNMC